MRHHIISALILLAGIVSFSACQDEENIIPSGNYSPIRGGFPQGDSEYDTVIYNIKQKFGVYLLYKDITEEDLNRDWVSAGTGDLYVAGYEDERELGAWNLPEEHLPFYVDYFNSYIFPNISPEFAKTSFPVKIYMIHNMRTEPRDFGDSIQSGGGTESDPSKFIKLGNFDNWAISFKEEIINGTSGNTEETLKKQRCIFIIQAIYNAMDKGEITSPEEFWSGYDFSDSNKKIDHSNKNSDNYKYKLGLVDDIYDHFATTGRTNDVWNYKEYIKSFSNWARDNKDNNLFNAYIKNAMWLTPEEFELRYPKSQYPIITEKYEIAVRHMKEKYGIDLQGVAYGLKD